MSNELDQLVAKAVSGDKQSLEQIIEEIKQFVYNLSLKMLLFPEEAQDATQEILIKIVTHLSTFQGNSSFKTWVYRVATNYLLSSRSENLPSPVPFEEYAVQIDTGQSELVSYARNDGELNLLEEEVKVSCTHGLLLCLKPISRLVYILGDILEFNSREMGEILGEKPEKIRKQLSRAREKVRNFLQAKCGLVNTQNPCRCKRKIDFLVNENMINPNQLRFAQHTHRSIDLFHQIDTLDRSLAVFKSVPVLEAPESIMKEIRETIQTINV